MSECNCSKSGVSQRVVNAGQHDGKYHNFFRYGLPDFISAGWIVKHIRDDGQHATVIFERDNSKVNPERDRTPLHY